MKAQFPSYDNSQNSIICFEFEGGLKVIAVLYNLFVAVNHENDTCFENRLVMDYADCKHFAGLVETSKVVSKVSLAHCQTHCKQMPVFSRLSKSHMAKIQPIIIC